MSWKRGNCFDSRWAFGRAGALMLAGFLVGCAGDPVNPSFPTKLEAAKHDLKRIEAAPKPLDRPLVVVGGYLDPGIAASWLRWEFSTLTSDQRILSIEL